MTVVLDLLNFVEVLFQGFACMRSVVPSLSFLDDCHDSLVSDDNLNVNRVVHLAENSTLIFVFNIDVIKKLQPESLKFVSIVLK